MHCGTIIFTGLLFLCSLSLLLSSVDGAKKTPLRNGVKDKKTRSRIVLCCGKNKCSNWSKNKRSNSTLRPGRTKASIKSVDIKVTNAIKSGPPMAPPSKNGAKTTLTPESKLQPEQEVVSSKSETSSDPEDVLSAIDETAPTSDADEPTTTIVVNQANSNSHAASSTSGNANFTLAIRQSSDHSSITPTFSATTIKSNQSNTATTNNLVTSGNATATATTNTKSTSTTTTSTSTNSTMTTSTMTTSTTINSTATTSTTTTSTTTTTTTTPPSPCKDPCLTFTNATKSMSANMTMPSGNYLMIGSKMIFVSSTKISLFSAAQQCMRLGMNLISADGLVKNLIAAVAGKFPTLNDFWTSGANEGEFCDSEKVYSWCSNGTRIIKNNIQMTFLDHNATIKPSDRCLAMQTVDSTLGLYHTPCSNTNLKTALCEPKCDSSLCPTSKCATDPSLFDSYNNLKDSDKLGYWAKTCGSTYFFSNFLGTWEQNWQKCCSLGMTPIVYETQDELKCISNFTIDDWKYNFNYWTGGTQKGCKGQWSWCSGVDLIPLPSNLSWAYNQPDNKAGADDCLQMRLLKNNTGVVLSDKNCSDKYVIACEGTPKIQSCLKPTYKASDCKRNKTLFVGEELKDFFGYGKWLSGCGRTFLFSKKKATWQEARETCCDIGTGLLSLEYDDKDTCVASVPKKMSSLLDTEFWTSGTDQGCKGVSFWAAANKKIINQKMSWTSVDSGDCITVQYQNGSSKFSKVECEKELNFICEVRNSGTIAQGLQNECMEVWNITIVDMLAFDGKYDASNITRNLKCFIKCLGENLELLSATGLTPSAKILRMIEDIAGEDEKKLQNSFGAYDSCSGKRGVDECDTAAGMHQCTRNEAPQVADAIFNQQLGNSTVYNPPTPCIGTLLRKCRMKHLPCVSNASLIETLASTNSTPMGGFKTTTNGTKYFVSIIPTPPTWTWLDSREYCCSLGMYLAHFPDYNSILDFLKFRRNLQVFLTFMDETYANGDGTDNYCNSNMLIPLKYYLNSAYVAPTCNAPSCWVLDMEHYWEPFLFPTSGDNCIPEKSTFAKYFVCK